ncbi:hypothetical protein ACJIZ3_024023 [Penstemon smallii]|uniref:Uncharacterized protein n=1 Tax=Penstemon smallii TaxID=265156 RepID=A0ABD3TQP0_9LAMI
MNPITAAVDPTAPPPPPPQPPRSSFSCDRHPTEQFSGFCPSCLCERLTTLDHSSSNTPSTSRRPSSASAAIKALFSSSAKTNNFPPPPPPPKPSKPTSFFSELRRTKSFSASKNEALGLSFEPQRKSCDVRVRSSTLLSLFTLDDDNKTGTTATTSTNNNNKPQISIKIESNKPIFEKIENGEDYRDPGNVENGVIGFIDDDDDDNGDEIRPVPNSNLVENFVELELNNNEIVEEEEVSVTKLKPMKDHIDLDTREKKSSVGEGFWAAASVFGKKWQKWRQKQKTKNQNNGKISATLPVEKPISRQYRETQSEIADYGFGRRSCDTGPRFSLDAGRVSFDDPRYSLDEPRASWSLPRMVAPMVSVMEDVHHSDKQIPVEEPKVNRSNGDECAPGGSAQTRDYYLDSSSSRRRKSLDRTSSIRKTATSVVAEIDEFKMVSNAKVSPTTADCFQGAKVFERGSNSNFLRDDCSETFELGNGFRDSSNSVIGNGDVKESKKSRRWSWRIWGFIHRHNKDEDEEDKYSRVNGVERSLSEVNRDVRGGFNRNMLRSNSSVSWRNGNHIGGSLGSVRKSSVETNGKKKDEFVLDRNRSVRCSPNHVDNGLLRFYLTPLRSSRKGGGLGKTRPNNSRSIARSVLRL